MKRAGVERGAMPIVHALTGDEALAVLEAHATCAQCGAPQQMLRTPTVPLRDLALPALASLDGQLEDSPCAACGGPLVVQDASVCYWPDEPGLPALGWQRRDGETQWFLAHTEEPLGIIPAASSVGDSGRIELLDDVSEELLDQAWGRPLSVRHRWRILLGEAMGHAGVVQGAPLGPGMAALAVRAPDEAASGELNALLESAMAALGFTLPIATDIRTFHGEGDAKEWTGPWREAVMDGTLAAFCVTDRAILASRIAQVAEEYDLRAAAAPLDDAPGAEAARERASDGAIWVCHVEGVRGVIDPLDILTETVGRALTLSEGLRVQLQRHARMSATCGRVIGRLQERVAPHPVHAHATWSVVVEGARHAVTVNLERVLMRVGMDDSHPALEERLGAVEDALHEGPAAEVLGCGCEHRWHLRQLRPAGWPSECNIGGATWEGIHDVAGTDFALVQAQECPHAVVISPDDSPWPGDDYEQVQMSAVALDGGDGTALVWADNIATLLAHAPLATALANELAARLGNGPFAAEAPSTDLIVIGAPDGETRAHMDLLLREVGRRLDAPPPDGLTLGYRALIAPGEGDGAIDLLWLGAA